MPQGGSIITYCKNWSKNTKDPYDLGLAFNSIRLDLKEIILQQRSGSPLSTKETDIVSLKM